MGDKIAFSERGGTRGARDSTHAVEMDGHGAVSIHDGGFAAQGDDFPKDPHGSVGEGFKVFGVDAGSRFGDHLYGALG